MDAEVRSPSFTIQSSFTGTQSVSCLPTIQDVRIQHSVSIGKYLLLPIETDRGPPGPFLLTDTSLLGMVTSEKEGSHDLLRSHHITGNLNNSVSGEVSQLRGALSLHSAGKVSNFHFPAFLASLWVVFRVSSMQCSFFSLESKTIFHNSKLVPL